MSTIKDNQRKQRLYSIFLGLILGSSYAVTSICAFEYDVHYRALTLSGAERNSYQQEAQFIYEAVIQPLCAQYQRDFTVCTVGDAYPHVACRVARDFDATSVIIAPDKKNRVVPLCQEDLGVDNLVVFKKQLTIDQLIRLSECEHFDITYADSLLLSFQETWREALETMMKFGDYIIMHNTVYVQKMLSDQGAMKEQEEYTKALEDHGGILLAEIIKQSRGTVASRQQFILFHGKRTSVIRSNWRRKKLLPVGGYIIQSDFTKKELYKVKMNETTPYLRGINLRTYTGLDGVLPTHETILENIYNMRHLDHNDFLPCNLIVQGAKVVPIDFGDARRKLAFAQGFERCMNVFNTKETWVTYAPEEHGLKRS